MMLNEADPVDSDFASMDAWKSKTYIFPNGGQKFLPIIASRKSTLIEASNNTLSLNNTASSMI